MTLLQNIKIEMYTIYLATIAHCSQYSKHYENGCIVEIIFNIRSSRLPPMIFPVTKPLIARLRRKAI